MIRSVCSSVRYSPNKPLSLCMIHPKLRPPTQRQSTGQSSAGLTFTVLMIPQAHSSSHPRLATADVVWKSPALASMAAKTFGAEGLKQRVLACGQQQLRAQHFTFSQAQQRSPLMFGLRISLHPSQALE